jgi:hypothetical protein
MANAPRRRERTDNLEIDARLAAIATNSEAALLDELPVDVVLLANVTLATAARRHLAAAR